MVLSSNMAGVCAVYAGMHIHVCVWMCVRDGCECVFEYMSVHCIYGASLFFFGKALDFHDLACHNLHQVF